MGGAPTISRARNLGEDPQITIGIPKGGGNARVEFVTYDERASREGWVSNSLFQASPPPARPPLARQSGPNHHHTTSRGATEISRPSCPSRCHLCPFAKNTHLKPCSSTLSSYVSQPLEPARKNSYKEQKGTSAEKK